MCARCHHGALRHAESVQATASPPTRTQDRLNGASCTASTLRGPTRLERGSEGMNERAPRKRREAAIVAAISGFVQLTSQPTSPSIRRGSCVVRSSRPQARLSELAGGVPAPQGDVEHHGYGDQKQQGQCEHDVFSAEMRRKKWGGPFLRTRPTGSTSFSGVTNSGSNKPLRTSLHLNCIVLLHGSRCRLGPEWRSKPLEHRTFSMRPPKEIRIRNYT